MPVRHAARCSVLVLFFAALPYEVRGDEPAVDDPSRKHRLEFMAAKLDEFTLARADAPDASLSRTTDPVLRFSNPVRDSFSDGAIYLWLDEGRPAAAASLWIRDNGDFGRDFTSLADGPLRCLRDGNLVWSPQQPSLSRRPLPGAPAPKNSASLRLTQMRQLARRFSGVAGAWPREGLAELRLMPQPIYRYASEKRGVIDGAVFALAQANDPEVLVLLEALESASGEAEWHYTLARMTAVRLAARLDGEEIWSADGYFKNPSSPDDPYVEVLEGKYAPPK